MTNMTSRHRKPAAFRLDDPDVVLAPAQAEGRAGAGAAAGGSIVVTPAPEPALPAAAPALPAPSRRRFPFGTLFWSALGGLIALGLGLLGTQLVESLYARAEWLGVLGAACAVLTLAALLAILAREAIGLTRLKNIEKLQARAQAALAADDRHEAGAILRDLLAFEQSEPRLALLERKKIAQDRTGFVAIVGRKRGLGAGLQLLDVFQPRKPDRLAGEDRQKRGQREHGAGGTQNAEPFGARVKALDELRAQQAEPQRDEPT